MARSDDFYVGASPVPEVVHGAQSYTRASGLQVPDADYGRISLPKSSSQAIGRAYDRMPAFDPKALPAYHAMREETMRQFDHMTSPVSRGGMGIDVEVTKGDPYGHGDKGVDNLVNELRGDVQNRNRIKVLSTASTGGHKVFSNDDNDAFRAVHDVFGHLGSGRGIDMHGEEAAYQKHSRMFSPLARQAMASETRGQNSSFNLNGAFPDQKVGVLPQHIQALQFGNRGTSEEKRAAADNARTENRKQGLTS